MYGLKDPNTNAVRYVGKSSIGLSRPKSHTKEKDLARCGNSHKANWIRGLLRAGQVPATVVLESFQTQESLADAECFWIAQGRGLGWPLTNITRGGDGAPGHVVSPEARAAMRELTKRLWADPEYRARTTAAHVGKTQSAESRKKRSDAMLARSEQLKANMARLWADPEYRARMRAAHTDHKQSPETVEKRVAKMRGRPSEKRGKKQTPEHIAARVAGMARAKALRLANETIR